MMEQIEVVHQSLRDAPCETLREEFVMANWPLKKKHEIRKGSIFSDVVEYQRAGLQGDYKQFGIYNKIECRYMYKRSEIIPVIDKKYPGMLDAKTLSAADVRKLSIECRQFSSVLLPLKIYVLKHGLEMNTMVFKPIQHQCEEVLNTCWLKFTTIGNTLWFAICGRGNWTLVPRMLILFSG